MKPGHNLPPGRELDALVAKRLFGWRVVHEDRGLCHVWRPTPNSAERSQPVPEFSSDISAAWEVAEKLKTITVKTRAAVDHMGESEYFSLQYQPAPSIHGQPYWEAGWMTRVAYSADIYLVSETADTAPHAICLAALNACGVEVD